MPSEKHQYQHNNNTWEQQNDTQWDGYAGVALQPERSPEERQPGRTLVYLRLGFIDLRKLWSLWQPLPDSLYETHCDVDVRSLWESFVVRGEDTLQVS